VRKSENQIPFSNLIHDRKGKKCWRADTRTAKKIFDSTVHYFPFSAYLHNAYGHQPENRPSPTQAFETRLQETPMHLKWKGEASIYNNQQLEGTRHDKKKKLTACWSTLPTSAPTVGIFGRPSCTCWLFMITKERENKKKENKGKRADDSIFIVLSRKWFRKIVLAFWRRADTYLREFRIMRESCSFKK
jgi:hypothetical protein